MSPSKTPVDTHRFDGGFKDQSNISIEDSKKVGIGDKNTVDLVKSIHVHVWAETHLEQYGLPLRWRST